MTQNMEAQGGLLGLPIGPALCVFCFIYLGTHFFVVDVLVICELMNVGVISCPYLLECTLCSRGLECCTVSKVCVQFLYTDGWSKDELQQ